MRHYSRPINSRRNSSNRDPYRLLVWIVFGTSAIVLSYIFGAYLLYFRQTQFEALQRSHLSQSDLFLYAQLYSESSGYLPD